MIDIAVFGVNKTFDDLSLHGQRTILHWKYVKEVVIGSGHIYLLKAQA